MFIHFVFTKYTLLRIINTATGKIKNEGMNMNSKRTIRGEKYSIEQLVSEAVATAQPDTAAATARLAALGHTNPDAQLVNRYARDAAVLAELQRATGAAFSGQIGKIGFDDMESAVRQVNSYLNRRNQAQRSRWGK